jgi:protein SCO1/2
MSVNVRLVILVVINVAAIAVSIAAGMRWADPAGDVVQFELMDQHGRRVASEQWRGRWLIAYFGFTHCRGPCPVQVSVLRDVLGMLDASGHTPWVVPAFITVDPERDTPERLAGYLAGFDSRIVGLTGDTQALQAAAASFATSFEKRFAGLDSPYEVSHTTQLTLVDPAGRIKAVYPMSHAPIRIANAIRAQL